MRQVKIAGREWGCSSLQYKRKIRGPETLTHTFTKRIEEKTSQNDNNNKINRKKNKEKR